MKNLVEGAGRNIETGVINQAIEEVFPPSGSVLTGEILQRQAAIRSKYIESPYLPGLLLKKQPIHYWLEKNKAAHLETVYDYLHRVYRVEQIVLKDLAQDWEVSKRVAENLIKSAGVPKLRSYEYIDPHRAATARRWEDQEASNKTKARLKVAWESNKTGRVEKTQSEQAKKLRRASLREMNKRKKNGSTRSRERNGMKEAEKRAVLGEDPRARLCELFEVQGLGYNAAVKALGDAVSVRTLERWAIEEQISGRPSISKGGLQLSQYENYQKILANSDKWDILPVRHQEVLSLIKDPSGRYRQGKEIAQLTGLSAGGIHYIISSSIEKFSTLDPQS